jgi:lipoprotein-releasing system permease protein
LNLSFFIARRYLVKQKGTFSSFIIRLAIVATALSVAVMIVSLAVISGFKYTIRQKLFSFLGHVHVETHNPNRSLSLTLDPLIYDSLLVKQMLQEGHIKQLAIFAARPAIVQAKGQMEGLLLKGVNKDYKYDAAIKFSGNPIHYIDTSYNKQLLLSKTTADKLNINAGDSIQLYFLEPGANFPRIRKVQVAGFFHTGMEDLDRNYAICDIRLLQRVNNWSPQQISGYQLELDDEYLADSMADHIYQKYLKPPVTTYTIKDIYPNIYDWLDLQDVNARIILLIMAVVAIINLATALVILIVEQSRMVGLLKALGMGFKPMQGIFLYHAGIIAGAGILLGNILALGLCWLQLKTGFIKLSEETYFMKQAPVRIEPLQVIAVDAVTLLLCVLCMLLPTLYIRRIRPAQVLQFK